MDLSETVRKASAPLPIIICLTSLTSSRLEDSLNFDIGPEISPRGVLLQKISRRHHHQHALPHDSPSSHARASTNAHLGGTLCVCVCFGAMPLCRCLQRFATPPRSLCDRKLLVRLVQSRTLSTGHRPLSPARTIAERRNHAAEMRRKREGIQSYIQQLERQRRGFNTSFTLSHGHIDPPKAGEEYVYLSIWRT